MIKEILNEEEFNGIINGEMPTLVDFWATWCGPCRMQTPILHDLEPEIEGKAIIAKVNVDENESLAIKYGVSAIPTIIIFKKGEVVDKTVGLSSKEDLLNKLSKHI